MKSITEIAENTLFPLTIGSLPVSTTSKAIETQARYGIHFPSTGEVYVQKVKSMAIPFIEAFNGVTTQGDEILVTDVPQIKTSEAIAQLGIVAEVKEAIVKVEKLVTSGKYPDFKGLKICVGGPGTLMHAVYNDTGISDKELMLVFAKGLVSIASELVKAGARAIQIDEPFLARSPRFRQETVEALAALARDLKLSLGNEVMFVSLHACEEHSLDLYRSLLGMPFDILDMEFVEHADKHFDLVKNEDLLSHGKNLGVGVVSSHSEFVETEKEISNHVQRIVNAYEETIVMLKPDCALKDFTPSIAENKLERLQFARAKAINILGLED